MKLPVTKNSPNGRVVSEVSLGYLLGSGSPDLIAEMSIKGFEISDYHDSYSSLESRQVCQTLAELRSVTESLFTAPKWVAEAMPG